MALEVVVTWKIFYNLTQLTLWDRGNLRSAYVSLGEREFRWLYFPQLCPFCLLSIVLPSYVSFIFFQLNNVFRPSAYFNNKKQFVCNCYEKLSRCFFEHLKNLWNIVQACGLGHLNHLDGAPCHFIRTADNPLLVYVLDFGLRE